MEAARRTQAPCSSALFPSEEGGRFLDPAKGLKDPWSPCLHGKGCSLGMRPFPPNQENGRHSLHARFAFVELSQPKPLGLPVKTGAQSQLLGPFGARNVPKIWQSRGVTFSMIPLNLANMLKSGTCGIMSCSFSSL